VALLRQMQGGAAGGPPSVDVVQQQHIGAGNNGSFQHVVDRADIVLIRARQLVHMKHGALEPGAVRLRPGAQQHLIRAAFADIVFAEFRVEFDPDLELLKLCQIPVQKLRDFTAFGLTSREAELSAKLRPLLNEANLMAARGKNTGGFQSCRPTTDDQNVLGSLGATGIIAVPGMFP